MRARRQRKVALQRRRHVGGERLFAQQQNPAVSGELGAQRRNVLFVFQRHVKIEVECGARGAPHGHAVHALCAARRRRRREMCARARARVCVCVCVHQCSAQRQ